jgi:hypothetical protein
MVKKILFGIIGALVALFLFVLAVMAGTGPLGFQNVAVLELGFNMIAGFVCWKKFPKNEMIASLSLGALYGSIVYLALIFIFKTVVFSLLGSITA